METVAAARFDMDQFGKAWARSGPFEAREGLAASPGEARGHGAGLRLLKAISTDPCLALIAGL
jgi:hypothetical protein